MLMSLRMSLLSRNARLRKSTFATWATSAKILLFDAALFPR
jgi:hypothetical protein